MARFIALAALTTLVVLAPVCAFAQTRDDAAASGATLQALDELRARLVQQTALIAAQSRQIEAQNRDIDALRKRLDPLAGSPGLEPGTPSATQALESRVETVEQTIKRLPELPERIVTTGEFPGSIRVPATDAAFKLGGQLRSTLVHTLAPLGTDDRFIASAIPVSDQRAGEGARATYTRVWPPRPIFARHSHRRFDQPARHSRAAGGGVSTIG